MNEKLWLGGMDEKARVSLEIKLQVLRDQVTAIAMGFKTGLFLYGNGGVGKSFTVLNQLDKLKVKYQLHNSRITAKGLFDTLKHACDLIHVLEDMERLTKDPDAQGVLRSALWCQAGQERMVTWTTGKSGPQQFAFRGGLILISNRPMADLPELRALATRIEVHCLQATEAELAAKMYELACLGFSQNGKLLIGKEECLMVTEHLLGECRSAGCPLHLRLQHKAFQTYLQWEGDWSDSHWRDLVSASVHEVTRYFRHESNTLPREARKLQRRNILREIIRQNPDPNKQQELYMKETNASRADFYRRKAEIDSGEFGGQEAA